VTWIPQDKGFNSSEMNTQASAEKTCLAMQQRFCIAT
jgi:hypothetical protein